MGLGVRDGTGVAVAAGVEDGSGVSVATRVAVCVGEGVSVGA